MAKKKYIKTPDKLWEFFSQYREETKSNPIKIVEQRKGTINIPKDFAGNFPDAIIELPLQRPLTMEGFQNYLENQGIITDVTDYFENKDNRYSEYVRIASRVRREIRDDQITGGMCGVFNSSITARLNGLTEKIQAAVTTDNFLITLNLTEPKKEDPQ